MPLSIVAFTEQALPPAVPHPCGRWRGPDHPGGAAHLGCAMLLVLAARSDSDGRVYERLGEAPGCEAIPAPEPVLCRSHRHSAALAFHNVYFRGH